jgi:hypothetical protein
VNCFSGSSAGRGFRAWRGKLPLGAWKGEACVPGGGSASGSLEGRGLRAWRGKRLDWGLEGRELWISASRGRCLSAALKGERLIWSVEGGFVR